MPYPFLVQLEDEIRKERGNDREVMASLGLLPAAYRHAFHLRSGLLVGDVKIMSRMVDALNKWHARWGDGASPAMEYLESYDEQRMKDAYESMQMHQPFDTEQFLTAFRRLTGNMLTQSSRPLIPNWMLSPDNDYWDMPNRLMEAMRDVWYGKRKEINWWLGTLQHRYRYHRCHYFIYQPEPELWFTLIRNAKPSYVKGRFYAYTHAKDMSVLREPMLRPHLANVRNIARKATKAKK